MFSIWRYSPWRCAVKNLIEIPFISGTVLDSSFGTGAGIRKARKLLCKTFDPGLRVSIGKAGSVQLNSVAALDCVATAGVANARDAQHLADAYNNAGMAKLVQSKR